MLVVEGDFVDGRVLFAEGKLDGGEGRVEHREGRGFREVPQDAGVRHVDGDHDGRFRAPGDFFGGGWAKTSR